MAKNPRPAGALRRELEHRLQHGRCAYCRTPAAPDRPLTREHVIPRARGGRRKDFGIIVPACARCNHHRGCREFVLFLLARPRRISSFLDYLDTLPTECLAEVDLRVIAELYAAISLLSESARSDAASRERLRRLSISRRLHRRRYAARRVVGAVTARLERMRRRTRQPAGPSCLLPHSPAAATLPAEGSLAMLRAGLVTVLARIAEAPAEWVLRELVEELRRVYPCRPGEPAAGATSSGWLDAAHAFRVPASTRSDGARPHEVVSLESWNRRRQKWRRSRMGRREGKRVRGYAA